MTMTPEQQKSIIAKESAWIDADQFAPLDLSAFPALQPPPAPEVHDNRWAKDWRDTALSASAAELRKFVLDPDTETLERVGNEIGHEGLRDEVQQRKGESIAAAFKRANPAYLATDNNYRLIATTLAFNALPASQQEGELDEIVADLIDARFWSVTNPTSTYRALDAEGLLDVPVGTARNLSDKERLHVTRLAQVGRTEDAVSQYLQYALDGEEPGVEILNDPNYRQCCDDAVFTVFEAYQSDYAPTPERERYLLRYAAGRPLTLTLLTQAWRACQQNEQRHERSELLTGCQRPEDTPPPSAKELDALDNAAVDRLYHDSLKEIRAVISSQSGSAGVISLYCGKLRGQAVHVDEPLSNSPNRRAPIAVLSPFLRPDSRAKCQAGLGIRNHQSTRGNCSRGTDAGV